MTNRMIKAILGLTIALIGVLGVEPAADSSCNSQYQAFSRCMKLQLAKAKDPRTQLAKPNNAVSTNMQISNIRSCFTDNKCKDPLAPEAANRARGLCFPPALSGLRNETQACVKKNLQNFQLTEDEYSVAIGQNDVLLLLAATSITNFRSLCPSSVTQQSLQTCITKKYAASGITQAAATNYDYCSTLGQCKSTSMITANCYSSWNDLSCPCVQSIRFMGTVTKYENQYIDCMKKVGVTVDRSNDVALGWFDTSVKGFCDSTSTTRASGSWAPGNKACDGGAQQTTAKVTTTQATTTQATTTQATTTVETTAVAPEETTTLEPVWTTDSNQVGEETTTVDGEEPVTERTWFFDNWTDAPEETTESTTTVATTTAKSSWPQWMNDLGIQNPMDGVWGDLLNPGKWFNGKKR